MKLQYQLGGTGKGTGFPVGGNLLPRAYRALELVLLYRTREEGGSTSLIFVGIVKTQGFKHVTF